MNIRIVNNKGKYSLFNCLVDEDGYVEKIYDEVTFPCQDFHDIVKLIDAIAEAKLHSVTMVNASNKKDLFGALDD